MICTQSDEEDDDDEEEDTSSDEEEEKNSKLCLMARGDEDEEEQVNSSFEDYSNSDQEDAYLELLDKYDNVKRDNKHLKKKINFLSHDNTSIEKITSLESQLCELKNILVECE